jgi:hypothetical protein
MRRDFAISDRPPPPRQLLSEQDDGLVKRHGSVPSKADRTFDCHPAGVGDPDPSGLIRPAARPHGFGQRRREPIFHKLEQFEREPRKEPRIGTAALSCGGQHFECPMFPKAYHGADHTERSKRSDVILTRMAAGPAGREQPAPAEAAHVAERHRADRFVKAGHRRIGVHRQNISIVSNLARLAARRP